MTRGGLTALRRVCSAAVRTAYASARRADGTALRQKELRDLFKARLAYLRIADAWLLHCATLGDMDLRRIRPDGGLVVRRPASTGAAAEGPDRSRGVVRDASAASVLPGRCHSAW